MAHYHLTSRMDFDKENACNGEFEIDPNNLKFINPNNDPEIKPKTNTIKPTYIFDCKNNNTQTFGLKTDTLFDYVYNEEIIQVSGSKGKYNFTTKCQNITKCQNENCDNVELKLVSQNNKGDIDKTYSGDTWKIFSKSNQYYHGGSQSTYNENLIKENMSHTLFYAKKTNYTELPKELDTEENIILTGLGLIQNKIGILNTNNKNRKGKIYCYNHYKEEQNPKEYFLFRFPFHELVELQETKEIRAIIEAIKIEDNDKKFFREQSLVVPSGLILKYSQKLYEQIMKIKQNTDLWDEIKTKSKDKKWNFCDDESIQFLRSSIQRLRENQASLKNPGYWAIKDYLNINAGNNLAKFEEMCDGGAIPKNFIPITSCDKKFKKFIFNTLLNYPIYNKKTIQRIFHHIGAKAIFIEKNSNDELYVNSTKLCVDGYSVKELIEYVNDGKDLFKNKGKNYDDIDARRNAINYYLRRNNFPDIDKELLKEDPKNSGKIQSIFASKLSIKIEQEEYPIITLEDNPYHIYEEYNQNDDASLLFDDIDWGEKIINSKFCRTDVYRLRAIIVEYIKNQENTTGHVWVSFEDAQNYLMDRLIEFDGKCEKFHTIDKLKIEKKFEEIFTFNDENKFMTLKVFFKQEEMIKKTIYKLISSSESKKDEVLKQINEFDCANPNFKFKEGKHALIKMQNLDFVFVSGVAGSGKSHTLCEYIDSLCSKYVVPDFQVLTPTGKAADVLFGKFLEKDKNSLLFPKANEYFYNKGKKQQTEKISTAHSFIKSKLSKNGKNGLWNQNLFCFQDDLTFDKKDTGAYENLDILIIDEISMVTLDIFYYILRRKRPKKVIILGDIKQLPPIGYGSLATSFYNYLLGQNNSEYISLARMETSHRADENSLFIKHSLTLRDEEKQISEDEISKDNQNENFKICSYNDDKSLKKHIKDIYCKERSDDTCKNEEDFKESIKCNNTNIQILCTNNIGDFGTYSINEFMVKSLEQGDDISDIKFIQNKNDKDSGLSNGIIGFGLKDSQINFDGKEIKYNSNSLGYDYSYGYAITVHKSQGSGFPVVILVLPEKMNAIITKELIYTALTRPEKKMYILYHENNIAALTQLLPQGHRNMNVFDTDKSLWEQSKIRYPIEYKKTLYRRKQDLYAALMLDYAEIKNFEYFQNGSFTWENDLKFLNLKNYMESIQDKDTYELIDFINIYDIYKIFDFKVATNTSQLIDRSEENKPDYIEQKRLNKIEKKEKYIIAQNDRVLITTHNGLITRSWSEAILMLIFDHLQVPYFYEAEIWAGNNSQVVQLTYGPNGFPNNGKELKLLPDFVISFDGFNKENDKFEIKNSKFIIEHLGMLENMGYKNHWKEKIKKYHKLGYSIIPINFIYKDEDNTYQFSKVWDENGDTIDSNGCEKIEPNIKYCITTDEEDLKDIDNLIEKLELLKKAFGLE